MRRIALPAALLALLLAPGAASAKLPFFGLDVDPVRPDVGEPVAITMTCYEDMEHTRPRGACFGAPGVMAWVHPLDDEGELARDDWLSVEGHATTSGASRGTIVLTEPGVYGVIPLWRTWGPEHSEGFPGRVRIEVGRQRSLATPIAVAAAGLVALRLAIRRRGRRTGSG
jgi:hypothetical protein